MYRRSTPSLASLPQLHRLSLNAASTAAPGEYPPTLRDIVELELLLQRLFELEETDEDGVVILSDEDQLHRMLFSLRVLYAQVADQPRPPGGPLMTDEDVNVLTNIVFELGAARAHASRTRRSFFLTSGAYSRKMEVLEQLAPGQRGARARAVAQQNLQDRLNREEQQRLQREAEERRRREAEEEERRQAAERRRREAEEEERRVRPRIVDDDDDDEPFNVHPAAVVGWSDFVDAMGKHHLVVQSAVSNPSRAHAIAREVAAAQLRNEGGVPDERFAEVLATRLIEERVLESFYRDDAFLSIRLRSELLRLAWDYVGSAVRRDLDFAAASFFLNDSEDRVEITPDENLIFDDDDNSESRLIRWLLTGGRGFHRDSHFFTVAQGLAAAATNDAANDAAFKESREGWRACCSRSHRYWALGREVLARQYLGELQSAGRGQSPPKRAGQKRRRWPLGCTTVLQRRARGSIGILATTPTTRRKSRCAAGGTTAATSAGSTARRARRSGSACTTRR